MSSISSPRDPQPALPRMWGRVGWALLAAGLLLYPMIFSGAFYRDIGVTFLLAAISASAWNIVGGYAGQVSVGHSMFFGLGAYTPLLFYTLWGWPPIVGIPFGIVLAIGLAVVIGMPTFRLTGHYFSMATIAVAELIRIFAGTWDLVGAAIGLQGPATARGWWDLTFRGELPYYYIFLAVLAIVLLVTTAAIERRRFGFYLRAIKASERAARSLGVPVRQTKMQGAGAVRRVHLDRRLALCRQDRLHRSGFRAFGILISVQMVIVAALGRRRHAVRPAGRRADPDAAADRDQQLVRRRRLRPDLHPLWRHHRLDRALRAGRLVRTVAARGAAIVESAPMLLEAKNVAKAFGEFLAVRRRRPGRGGGRDHRPDRPERRRQIDLLQLPCRRDRCRPPAASSLTART